MIRQEIKKMNFTKKAYRVLRTLNLFIYAIYDIDGTLQLVDELERMEGGLGLHEDLSNYTRFGGLVCTSPLLLDNKTPTRLGFMIPRLQYEENASVLVNSIDNKFIPCVQTLSEIINGVTPQHPRSLLEIKSYMKEHIVANTAVVDAFFDTWCIKQKDGEKGTIAREPEDLEI